MNMFLIIRLLAAHFVGDFLLQDDAMCKAKNEWRTQGGLLHHIAHAALHALLAYVFVAQWTCWILPLIVFISHFAIDIIKSAVGKDDMVSFVIDQLMHLLVIAGIYICLFDKNPEIPFLNWQNVWVIALAYIIVLTPSSVFIDVFNKRFDLKQGDKSLPKGGKNIGYLERIMIISFILSGWMEGIGYLLAAKSVFRFGELKNNQELRHTEYVLLGTFLSFTIAVVVGFIARQFMN